MENEPGGNWINILLEIVFVINVINKNRNFENLVIFAKILSKLCAWRIRLCYYFKTERCNKNISKSDNTIESKGTLYFCIVDQSNIFGKI